MGRDLLSASLRAAVHARDGGRCRWCGATNQGTPDLHHVEYRRGVSYDHEGNLISLCRACHSFVHGNPRPSGQRIVKPVAQEILKILILSPGRTGSSVWRQKKRLWISTGKCEHGNDRDTCPYQKGIHSSRA